MKISKKEDVRLKLGNLALALLLSTVPTAITICGFYIHGANVCSALDKPLQETASLEIRQACNNSSKEFILSYIIWIWLFISLPTWRWFYLGHIRRIEKDRSRN